MILVTGGTGYIGSDLVDRLRDKYNVKVLTRKSKKSKDFEFVKGNITDYKSMLNATKDVDYIYHLAGITERKGFGVSKEKFFEVNVDGTENVLRAGIENSVKKIIFVSSVGAIYEDMTIYGLSKRMAEEVVKRYSNKINVITIRPSFVYDEERFRSLKKYRIFPKLGIDFKFHPTFKEPLIRAFLNSIKCKRNGFYNIADRKPVKINDISNVLKNDLGINQIYIPKILIGIGKFIPQLSGFIRTTFKDREFNIKDSEEYLKYKPEDTIEAFKRIFGD
ncbi:MAG: NAD(P)-dependent oxidoreductase [Candidatus Aenigmarchaeota archaeon]|nr:NAD(P)-dependent oxidoreductase [Candidatus Aenigmarchaeota archaeon]